jgi:hypothetical protein
MVGRPTYKKDSSKVKFEDDSKITKMQIVSANLL